MIWAKVDRSCHLCELVQLRNKLEKEPLSKRGLQHTSLSTFPHHPN